MRIILSIKGPLICDNLVGSVICGGDVVRSNNSLHNSSFVKAKIWGISSDTHQSTYKFKRAFFRLDRRTAPKFGTHVRMETRLALTKKN